jgi:hypothetical protein
MTGQRVTGPYHRASPSRLGVSIRRVLCPQDICSDPFRESFIIETMAEQQVNLTDLDLNQLQDVKKQLDSVSSYS